MKGNLRKKGSTGALRTTAIFEASKGILVLVTGFGLLHYIHQDLHVAAEQILNHLHFHPAGHHSLVFIDALTHLNDWQLWALAFSALFYSLVRFAEAYGLWHERSWAEWFGFLTGGMYIPLEIFEVIEGVSWPKVLVLSINLFVVLVLALVLIQSRKSYLK
ncbi:MAG: DUF2127 domain-containing protein [Syntrophaceae bacterium]|nr:DUF2127 domain-containing protein [Syntrophaceae bacterium]